MITLENIVVYVPEKKISPLTSYEKLGITIDESPIYSRIYGLNNICIEENQSFLQTMTDLVNQLLKKNTLSANQIKYLIHARTSTTHNIFGESLVRNIAAAELTNALFFASSFNKCVSVYDIFELLDVAELKESEFAIILSGEFAFTHEMRSIPTISLTSDVCAATLISKNANDRTRLITQTVKTYGEFAKGIWLSQAELKTFGDRFVHYMQDIMESSLKKANLKLEDIKLILPHNVNLLIWRKLAKHLKIDFNKIYTKNITRYGHCFNADIFLNYKAALEEGFLKPGDYFLAVTVSVGASFASAIFQR